MAEPRKEKHAMFDYQGTRYKVHSRFARRWTNSGYATRVFAVNTSTGLGGRYFDLDEANRPFRFSPD